MKQFVQFLFAGGVAAGANFGSRFLYSRWVDYELAVTFAYLTGMLVAFLLMRGLVFNAKDKALTPQIFNFVVVNLFALLQTLVISVGLVRWVFPQWATIEQVEAITQLNAEAIAHLIGVLTPVITSYFGHKFLTFR